MQLVRKLSNDILLLSEVTSDDVAVLESCGFAASSINDRVINGKECECWARYKNFVPLAIHYSFDSEVPVYLFDTEEKAKAELKAQFEKELKIQTEENGHVLGEDIETAYDESGTWASITIFWDENKDVMEWTIGSLKN